MHPQGVADMRPDLEQDRLGKRSMGKKTNCEDS
jgi:hypothetical protein